MATPPPNKNARANWPVWRFDIYRNGQKKAEGVKVHAPNYEAAHAKAMGLTDAGESIVLDEGPNESAPGEDVQEAPAKVSTDPRAKAEALALYEQIAGDPEIYQELFALMSHDTDALPQRQAFNVAFDEMSESLDATVAAIQKVDQILAEAATVSRELRRIAGRTPEADITGGELEAAAMHIEAVAAMQAATSRLWRFVDWWAQVPVQAEGWEHFRAEAANQLNSFR